MTKAESLNYFYEKFPHKDKVDKATFAKIINCFNSKASNVISDGETLCSVIGCLKLNRLEGKRNLPDWGKSNKRKKEILESGGIPKSKLNPDGEDWLVYYQNDFIYKTVLSRRLNCAKNIRNYSFKSYRGHKLNVSASSKTGLLDLKI